MTLSKIIKIKDRTIHSMTIDGGKLTCLGVHLQTIIGLSRRKKSVTLLEDIDGKFRGKGLSRSR